MMNILIANTQEFNPQIGGVEQVSSKLAAKLSEMGHNVYFVACLKSKFSKEYKPAAEHFFLPEQQYLTQKNATALQQLCEQKDINIILNQAGNVLDFTKLCADGARETGIPLVSAIHTNPAFACNDYIGSKVIKIGFRVGVTNVMLSPLRQIKLARRWKQVCSISDRVVLLSERYIEDFLKLVGGKFSDKVIAISNPCDIPLTSKKEINKEKVVLYVGRLNFREKRPDRLIQIWENVSEDYPDWKLRFVGDGPLKAILENYVQTKGIRNVQFLGFCEPSSHYEVAPILCMTSSIEGFGMVLTEGLSYGCIPIAFDSFKAVFDIIDDQRNGFIVKSFDLANYEKQLRLLLDDKILRERMRQETTRKVAKFNISSIADRWNRLFYELQ